MSVPPTDDPTPHAHLSLPADHAYVAVLRTTAAGLAARLDFTVDDIEDLKMAVGEACALVLDEFPSTVEQLDARFVLADARMRVTVSSTSSHGPVDTETFGWQMLSALTLQARVDKDVDQDVDMRSVTFEVASTVQV